MKLPLNYYGNSILRKKTTPVTEINDAIKQLVDNMIDTMEEKNGIGLAAPQVGQSLSVFITKAPVRVLNEDGTYRWEKGQLRVFINPEIIGHSDETWTADEGCLSIPGLYAGVDRPITVRVRAFDLDGNTFEEEFSWWDAKVIFHENDHINGVLFIDRLPKKLRQDLEPKLHEIKKKYKSG